MQTLHHAYYTHTCRLLYLLRLLHSTSVWSRYTSQYRFGPIRVVTRAYNTLPQPARAAAACQVAAGVEDEDIMDELTVSVGLPGVPFYVDSKAVFSTGKPPIKPPPLPTDAALQLVLGEHAACDLVLAYHKHTCGGAPNTKAGRDHALADGWASPEQAFALAYDSQPDPVEHLKPRVQTSETGR